MVHAGMSATSREGKRTKSLALSRILSLAIQPTAFDTESQHKADSMPGKNVDWLTAGHAHWLATISSAAEKPTSHPVVDPDEKSWGNEDVATFHQLFWAQECADNLEKLAAQQAHNTELARKVHEERASRAATMETRNVLKQQAADLQGKVQHMRAHQVRYSSRLPPRAPDHHSKEQLQAQLAELQEQHSRHQRTVAALRQEADVLDSIPSGGMGRVLAGDTTIDELRAAEERLVAELAARRQMKAERKKVICELQAEVERLQELGTSAQQETRLKAELQEAYALGAALQSKLDAQQCISTAPSQDGSGKGQDADGTSSSSASSSPLSSTSLGTLSTEDEPWQEDNLFNMDQCDWIDDSSSAAEACVSGPNANRSARKGSLEEFMSLRTSAPLVAEDDDDCWN